MTKKTQVRGLGCWILTSRLLGKENNESSLV